MCYSTADVPNLSTQKEKKKKDARFFDSYAQTNRSEGAVPPPSKIPPSPDGLIQMVPSRQRLVVKDFPRTAPVLGACSWLRVKIKPNSGDCNRYAVLFTGGKATSVTRHFLKRRILIRALKIKNNKSDYLFIVSGSGPKTTHELGRDMNQLLNIEK